MNGRSSLPRVRSAAMITVHVKLFATLRQHYPNLAIGEAMAVELPDAATVGQLIQDLGIRSELTKVVFVNNTIRGLEHDLADGDVVGIFPPVAGG